MGEGYTSKIVSRDWGRNGREVLPSIGGSPIGSLGGMVNLNGHETGNSGYSQEEPEATIGVVAV